MPSEKSEIYTLVGEIRKKMMPTSEVIVETALSELGLTRASPLNPRGKSPDDILKNFDAYLLSVFDKSLEVLERFESQVYPEALREVCNLRANKLNKIEASKGQLPFDKKVAEALGMLYPDLWQVFLSRSQSRKQRGGKDFEEQLGQLLKLADIPFDKQIRTYHSDFILPSTNAFNRDRTHCFLISAKRTLRERWQNVVNEIYETRITNAYLCTTDEAVNQQLIDRLRKYNIHLVIWDKSKQEKFKDEPVVYGYSQLTSEIQMFRRYWI